MTDDPTSEAVYETVVFEDVTVDPDAVLSAFGDESPEEIAAGAEAGIDRSTDEELDAIDVVAEDLFEELSEIVDDASDEGSIPASDEGSIPASDEGVISKPERDGIDEDAPEIIVCRPTKVVDEDTSDFFDSIFDDRTASSSKADEDEELQLVGPGPEPVKVENEAFGST